MKKIPLIVFCISLFCNCFYGQHRLFEFELPAYQLHKSFKLTNEYASTFSQVLYYQQNNFKFEQDLIFNLPNNQLIQAKFDKIYSYKNGSFSATYIILNEENSELVFSKYNDVITGMYIGQNHEKFIFQQTDQNIMAICLVNELKLIEEELSSPCISENDLNLRATNHESVCLESTTCAGSSVIDLMIVYTEAARLGFGGTNLTLSNIATIVSNLNDSLGFSGITNVSFNIVHTHEVNYTETTNLQTDLDRLQATNDGFMDEIHGLRDTYGADLVPLIIGTTTGGCGIGNLNTSTTNYSNSQVFSITRFGCANANLSLSHELGHNFGLRHDWYVDSEQTPCSHHHGYINQTAINNGLSSTTTQRWRTIMTYNNHCVDLGFTCARINRWSNPELSYNGDVLGANLNTAQPSHEAYAFRRMACVVANFKSPLNTEFFSDTDIRLYPNPAHDNLNIETSIVNPIFLIYNTLGQKLFQTTNKNINIENLASGVYYLSIKSETQNGQQLHKFIKS